MILQRLLLALAMLALLAIAVGSLLPGMPQHLNRLPAFLPHYHLVAYAIVGALMVLGLRADALRMIVVIASLTIYGAAIELLQEFVPGRGGNMHDFWLNATGAALGAGAAWVLGLAVGFTRLRRAD